MALHEGKPAPARKPEWRRDDAAFRGVREQLRAYFAGELRTFDLPLRMAGTPFQRQVWQGLLTIPFGDDHQLCRAGPADRPAGCGPRGRGRQRPKPESASSFPAIA